MKSNCFNVATQSGRGATLSEGTFLGRLHDMIEYAEDQRLQSIISWTPDGRAIVIHDPDKLVEVLMHLFYGRIKYRSFLRQLNKWSFKRVLDAGTHKNAFQHPYFLRGRKALCEQMTREAFRREPDRPKFQEAAKESPQKPTENGSSMLDPTNAVPLSLAPLGSSASLEALTCLEGPSKRTHRTRGDGTVDGLAEFEGRRFHPLDGNLERDPSSSD
jgi:HSF-type DNA-binding